MEIWVPILVVCIIGLICGVGLSVASSVMAVKEDERFPAIRDCLPGANCGVLGVTMNVIADGMDYPTALLTALGCGLGFFMAMVIFSGVRSRVEDAEPPASFEGLPITLVSAAIVSLSFFGFSGVLDRLFG